MGVKREATAADDRFHYIHCCVGKLLLHVYSTIIIVIYDNA